MPRLERLEQFIVENLHGKRIQAQWIVIYTSLPDGNEEMTEAYVELETGARLHWTMDNNSFYDRRNSEKYVRVNGTAGTENVKLRKWVERSS